MSTEGGAEVTGGDLTPRVTETRPMPLNSRRVTALVLRTVAARLELPTSASPEDLRQIIDGKLVEQKREPRDVQVVIEPETTERPARVLLQDGEGTFLDAELLTTEPVEKPAEEPAEDAHATLSPAVETGERAPDREATLIAERDRLAADVERYRTELESSRAESERAKSEAEGVKKRLKEVWRMNCDQLVAHDEELAAKDAEIAELSRKLSAALGTLPQSDLKDHCDASGEGCERKVRQALTMSGGATGPRRGKAPPVDPFSGDDGAILVDDWLPSLERAASWNAWTDEEKLLQLAGHLRGRALQEWNLIPVEEKSTFRDAVKSLCSRVNPENRVLAGQDFRHAMQESSESVADYIRRLERLFQTAYGRDGLGTETRQMLLYSQLQEGLRYNLIKSPAVSGAESYGQLCIAAKREEKRLNELARRQQYLTDAGKKGEAGGRPQSSTNKGEAGGRPQQSASSKTSEKSGEPRREPWREPRQCYICGSADHLARSCKKRKTESSGQARRNTDARAQGIRSKEDPLDFLHPDTDEESGDVKTVRIQDRGSRPREVLVEVQGVQATGIIDTGADISIMGPELFKQVAAVARLRKSAFKKPDKTPYTYDHRPFTLDGKLELDITFNNHTMCTPIYVKMDARDSLLLSEGVCHQLGIIQYHPDVGANPHPTQSESPDAHVPVVRVKLIHSVRIPPMKSAIVPVQLEEGAPARGLALLEPLSGDGALQFVSSLVRLDEQGRCNMMVTNPTGFTHKLEEGAIVGEASETECVQVDDEATSEQWDSGVGGKGVEGDDGVGGKAVGVLGGGAGGQAGSDGSGGSGGSDSSGGMGAVRPGVKNGGVGGMDAVVGCGCGAGGLVEEVNGGSGDLQPTGASASTELTNSDPTEWLGVRRVHGSIEERKQMLGRLLAEVGSTLRWQDRDRLRQLLLSHHETFAVEEGDRGETDLIQVTIDTGGAIPRRQAVRRTPFAIRTEVARQLENMQSQGVIQPSSSPWASPVVLVRKKDGSLRFCIDYRHLNLVTKPDVFPLPRMDDLLDQLGQSKFFSTLDLASGYWQVKIHPDSREKTAFITYQGLFEFRVMPFGLRNAPAVFQRLMQRVLAGLNPPEGPDFVSVYLDDVIVFSRTLDDHLHHLSLVIDRLTKAGLKLKPSKCHFISQEVQYLGHLLTPEGIRPNPDRVAAVRDYPTPRNVKEVRQFLGLASYYRRFVKNFAKTAQPLHNLTQKGAVFCWTPGCEEAFQQLKQRLIESPILVYPDFEKDFILETDASALGLGAVLSQRAEDSRVHPVAYASRSLSPQEKRYAITELETLAVVWSVSHFHAYLYGHDVQVFTDHSAVKAVLETPSPSGKHARWWSKMFGSGVRSLQITYRAGRENANADALSRCPPEDVTNSTPTVLSPMSNTASSDVQVAQVQSTDRDIVELLQSPPPGSDLSGHYSQEQEKDLEILQLRQFLSEGQLPSNPQQARRIAAQAPSFTLLDNIVYFIDSKRNNQRRCVVPVHLRTSLMEENHSGPLAGHFSGEKLFKALVRHWWWPSMYSDVIKHCANCPQCAIVHSSGRLNRPPLHPIPVQRVFQIVGVDVMDLPKTEAGNKHVIVFQDFLSKWPLVFPVPDQKAIRLARLLVNEVVPMFGVPEALLSDRGANLLSHLMEDVCKLLGIRKLNTTAYHPQCDGMVERFNRTLKTILRKHAARFGAQWDRYLPGVLWAYRNTPHDATGEKPSFLLLGHDCRTPTEACYLPDTPSQVGSVEDYREELMLSLTSARDLAAQTIQKAQERYKRNYDKRATYTTTPMRVGNWVFVRMPQEETGPQRKLSRPWHGPFRIISISDPDVLLAKVYFPQDRTIQVHQSRVKMSPPKLPSGFYWYGGKRRGPGRPPRWVVDMLNSSPNQAVTAAPLNQSNQSGQGDNDAPAADCADVSTDTPVSPTQGPPGSGASATHPVSGTCPAEPSSSSAPRPPCKYPLRNRRSGRT